MMTTIVETSNLPLLTFFIFSRHIILYIYIYFIIVNTNYVIYILFIFYLFYKKKFLINYFFNFFNFKFTFNSVVSCFFFYKQ